MVNSLVMIVLLMVISRYLGKYTLQLPFELAGKNVEILIMSRVERPLLQRCAGKFMRIIVIVLIQNSKWVLSNPRMFMSSSNVNYLNTTQEWRRKW